jgi:DNA-binding transcriptional MerR regulator
VNTTIYSKVSKLPQIPNKRYFTIGEVGFLCAVKPHVLRYWEQEFPQLKPAKRRGNRRYYQREDVLMVRHIRGLLYDEGYTISGARIQLDIMLRQAKTPEDLQESQYDHNHDPNYGRLESEITSVYDESPVQESKLTDLAYLSRELREISNSFTVLEAFAFNDVDGHHHDNSVNSALNYCDSSDLKYISQQLTAKPAEPNLTDASSVSHANHALKLRNYKLTIEDVIFELSDLLTEIQNQQVATV